MGVIISAEKQEYALRTHLDGGITDQFYRWRKEYGGLQIEQAKKNAQLR